MEQWQFLIQKQGDRSWHNLESPNLEISEGWYRVLARSHLRNTDVEIRIIHSSIQEIPPKRRIQKRSQRTNAEGLMAVIPFTHLQPGIWELQCSGDLISDLFGKSWQYGIYLQVFSEESTRVWKESHSGENIASNLPQSPDAIADGNLKSAITPEPLSSSKSDQEPTDLPTETVTDGTDIEQPVSPVFLKGESAEQILQNLMDLALPISETLLEEGKVEDSVAIKPRTPLCLTLERETHVAHWGEIVVIHGRVDLQDQTNQESDTAPPEILYTLELVIELRSPLSSEILTQVRQPLPNSSLPMVISSAIDIPIDCESKLILADINLYGALTEFGEVIILANQSFTITADVTELLAITAAAKFSEQNLLDHPIEPPTELETSISIDLRLFNLAKTTQINDSPFIQISRNKSLPPQLNPEELKAAGRRVSQLNKLADSRLPQLPKLPENQITVKVALTEGLATADVVTDQELVEKDKTRASINLAQLVIKNHRRRMLNSTFPYLKRLKVLPDNTPDAFSLPDDQDSPQIDTTVCEHENTFELVAGDAEFQDDSPDLELLELNAEANLCSSPLMRKWTQSQGFSLPESVISILDQQKLPDEQVPLSTQTVEISSSLDVEPQTDIGADQIPVLPDATLMAIAASAMEIQEMATFEQPEAISVLSPDSQLPPADYLWLTQEFVIEDIYTQPVGDVIDSYSSEQHSQPISDLSHTPLMQGVIVEPLPIPLLHVPDGELIGGTSVRVRVELPAISPQIVVKLWVEDCQTRWLLDGPHVLTDLLPNSLGSLFLITQLNIPYGCLEIRVEAIAFNQLTQQESHKVTVVRTVIPPDLPNLQLDQLLGI
ncbi:hypothetical protein [Nodularia spumigena]|uniref:hypothetical protein n=1 Tax=Nodularia spumigena TaxID=70799 RepID=UPI00232E6A89|nr:hypothetical protein [Nodularia spumigena]MDB9347795.1 hypothetical protein [Nodularia spumigena CS-588/01]MDB9350541.1 hypothetical protein [Nodularia spumigena CS-588/05]